MSNLITLGELRGALADLPDETLLKCLVKDASETPHWQAVVVHVVQATRESASVVVFAPNSV